MYTCISGTPEIQIHQINYDTMIELVKYVINIHVSYNMQILLSYRVYLKCNM